ncbi:hypothetical protein BDR26DRAFT_873105 [Obelidium mucronatum]|nr:hypothetical protein BDR26DRAFT_873105 [Obelidium mucronatum]
MTIRKTRSPISLCLALLPLGLIATLMLLLGLAPNAVLAPLIPSSLRNDKILHFVMFFLFTLSLFPPLKLLLDHFGRNDTSDGYSPLDRDSDYSRELVVLIQSAGVVSAVSSVFSEVFQAMLTARKFDISDVIGNIGGACLALVVVAFAAPRLTPERSNIEEVGRLVLRPEQWGRHRE